MFTLELLNQPAQEIIKYWKNTDIDLRWFDIVVGNEVTFISCKHSKDYFTPSELKWISKPILAFQELGMTPYLFSCSAYNKQRCYFPDGHYDTYLNVLEIFNWTEQLERYKYSLLLKATG